MAKPQLFKSVFHARMPRIFTINAYNVIRGITGAATDKYDTSNLSTAKPFEDMPKIPTLPIIGSAWVYFPIVGRYKLRKQHLADRHKFQTYGEVVHEKFGSFELVSSYVPETMELLFKHEGPYPVRFDVTCLKAYREARKDQYKSLGLIHLHGKEWAELRTKAQKHLMKPKTVLSYLNPMQDVARDLVTYVRTRRDFKKEMPNFLEDIYKWALESVAFVGLDTRLGCLSRDLAPDSDAMKMVNAAHAQLECMNKLEAISGNIQFWKYFPTPTWKKFQHAADTLTNTSIKYIKRSLEKLEESSDPDKDLTLLQAMLMTTGMDLSEVMVTVIDSFGAGIDTTSHSLGFLLYHLAKNPDKQEKLYDEIKQILPLEKDRITSENFNNLHYLKACIKESMRLSPVIKGIARILDHDVVVNGYRVPAGVMIFCVLQVIYQNEKYYSEPSKFLPERWLSKEKDINPFAYNPFGIGTRSCIGRRLAELEMICATTELFRNFRVEYHYEDIDMETPFVNIPDKPLRLRFLDR